METHPDGGIHINSIYVIGHKQPDTDSICSVIGYAELQNNEPSNEGTRTYIPARCGEVNPETAFALETFEVEAPVYIESVEPNVADIPFIDTRCAQKDLPTVDVATMMDQYDMRNMPITDDRGILLGLVSEYGLARAYVTRQRMEQLSIGPIRLDVLEQILSAQTVVAAEEQLEGKVYTAIDALHVTLSRLTANDVAIVGDNEPAQLALISAGIAALIIADGAPVGDRVINAARAQGVSVLATALDAFGVGKMIHLSLPASLVMETDIPIVSREDSLEFAKNQISTSKFRTACVTGEGGTFLGMLSRTTLMQEIQKSVVLLDHNEAAQAVDGIEYADIVEIIDHHRLGVISTLRPIRFINEPVGSTSTIITTMFTARGRTPSRSTAGLLLCGILSDTLVLRMSTTTEADRKAVTYLSDLLGIDFQDLGTRLIEKGMALEGLPITGLLARDTKHYDLFGKSLLIGQVMVPSFAFTSQHAEEIRAELAAQRRAQKVDFAITLFTSVFENASEVFAAGDELALQKLELCLQPRRLENVMSRKKDFLPHIGQLVRRL
ncbi:putative manganese-dependent inorganic diphosphatase [Methanosphaerula palustris]|uniref:inorganic diphosphatase n=1 Tax=Methanosphaerula palustris (strain ATCC BAA-1556 / DSM 19958 / E1-9c) TaxID=521011 RepID=B8GK59_METPE|nr:putative manganese-dependent inorganic diphosphatase [Methanosphaerula palustris]ACL17130.1 Inorganic diphosphatase [Methanosphaerula palustris E1-9c]